jgi:hypothetical protein
VPIIEFGLDWALGKAFGDIPGEALTTNYPDSRENVRKFQEDTKLLVVVRGFIDFGTDVQDSLQGGFRTAIVALISMGLTLYKERLSHSILLAVLSIVFLSSIGVLLTLLYSLWRRRLDPARVGAARNYRVAGLILALVAIAFDQISQ